MIFLANLCPNEALCKDMECLAEDGGPIFGRTSDGKLDPLTMDRRITGGGTRLDVEARMLGFVHQTSSDSRVQTS